MNVTMFYVVTEFPVSLICFSASSILVLITYIWLCILVIAFLFQPDQFGVFYLCGKGLPGVFFAFLKPS